MGFLDRKSEAEFPYHFDDVFDAIVEALKHIGGMVVDKVDRTAGCIAVKTGINLWTVGENIPITLSRVSPACTRVSIISSPKAGPLFGGALDMGHNRRNIESILTKTSAILSQMPPAQDPGSMADLAALADLRDRGEVSEETFQAKKRAILSGIAPSGIKPLADPSRRPVDPFLAALDELAGKRRGGEITQEEFVAAKTRLIAGRGRSAPAT